MDRLMCHVIQSCRECTWTRRGMQARRTAEDEAPSSSYWWWWWGGGEGEEGRDPMLDTAFINLSEVFSTSPLPYPPFLFPPTLPQSTSNDSQINKSRRQWAGEKHWQVDQSTGTTTIPTPHHCNRHCHHHHRRCQHPSFNGALPMATCFRRGSILRFWHFLGWLLVFEPFFLILIVITLSW